MWCLIVSYLWCSPSVGGLPHQSQRGTTMSLPSWSLSSTSSPTKRKTRGVPWRMICYPTCSCRRTAWSCWRRRRGGCWRKRGGTSRRNSGTGISTTCGFESRRGKSREKRGLRRTRRGVEQVTREVAGGRKEKRRKTERMWGGKLEMCNAVSLARL